MTGEQAAKKFGVSRRTLYRWAKEGRLHPWEWEKVSAIKKRRRGPRRSPGSIRYTTGRHDFATTVNP